MEITVQRMFNAPDDAVYRASTTGEISLDGQPTCFSLEPTALMIPAATYPVKMLWSNRFQRPTPHILNVPERTEVEMHGGNKATDSDGCILCAEVKISDYEIYESKPATDAIEEALNAAEANGEVNTVTVSNPA
jgi:hypothetical protein